LPQCVGALPQHVDIPGNVLEAAALGCRQPFNLHTLDCKRRFRCLQPRPFAPDLAFEQVQIIDFPGQIIGPRSQPRRRLTHQDRPANRRVRLAR